MVQDLITPLFPFPDPQIVRVAGTSRWTGENAFNPSYNAAPGATRSPVVRVAQGMGREICTMR